jgi:hypothetical protein
MQTRTGDELIERIRAHSTDDAVVGPAANDLLDELYRGYPVENLRVLLQGDEPSARTGAWLLSELGERAAPLLDDVAVLLAHRHRNVRFFAVDVVLENAGGDDGPLIARTINLITDPESAVRWKVLGFLADATTEQLMAGAAHLPPGRLADLARWLIGYDTGEPDRAEVAAGLSAPDPLTRLFAVAVAARLAEEDTALLEQAAAAADEEVRTFARERLEDAVSSG